MFFKFAQSIFAKLILIALVVFAFVSNIRLAVHNYHINQEMEKTDMEIELKEKRNKRLAMLEVYYASDDYQEVQARSRNRLKKEGENVVIFKGLPPVKTEIDTFDIISQAKEDRENRPSSNIMRWWKYFFD